MHLWPYMEETGLAARNNLNNDFYLPPGSIDFSMAGLCGQFVSLYNCPDDFGSDQNNPTTQHQRRRGNYVVNWGNSLYGQNPEPLGKAPFSQVNGSPSKPRITKINMLVDGTSHTLLMSEVLKAQSPQDNDWRGDIHNDQGECRFHTLLTPNTSAPDVIKNGWFQDTNDPLMPAVAGAADAQVTAARSRHPGGVNASFCDGSVHFISDYISLATWKALGTMNGKETVGSFE